MTGVGIILWFLKTTPEGGNVPTVFRAPCSPAIARAKLRKAAEKAHEDVIATLEHVIEKKLAAAGADAELDINKFAGQFEAVDPADVQEALGNLVNQGRFKEAPRE